MVHGLKVPAGIVHDTGLGCHMGMQASIFEIVILYRVETARVLQASIAQGIQQRAGGVVLQARSHSSYPTVHSASQCELTRTTAW
jgi:hypothetical protein